MQTIFISKGKINFKKMAKIIQETQNYAKFLKTFLTLKKKNSLLKRHTLIMSQVHQNTQNSPANFMISFKN